MNAIVKILPNFKYFDQDDSDFTIMAKEEKELPERHLRSYSIKHYLFTGKLRVVTGEIIFHMKHALIYVDADTLYGKEFGKYFQKDLELDTLVWLAEDRVPEIIKVKLNPSTSVPLNPVKVEEKTEETDAGLPETSDNSGEKEADAEPEKLEVIGDIPEDKLPGFEGPEIEVIGDATVEPEEEEPINPDLNEDGVFDEKDKALAEEVLETELPEAVEAIDTLEESKED